MTAVHTGRVRTHGHEFAYSEVGSGDRVVVLLHGLMFHRKMDERLAAALADRGFRVICLDQLGHGESDRPIDPAAYSMQQFAHYVLGVLDYLCVEEAVIAGRSMGANTGLEIALLAPERLRGLIAEGPILEGAQTAAMVAFGPFFAAGALAAPAMRALAAGTARVRRGRNLIRDMYLDALGGDPAAKAALLQGIMFGRTAPPAAERSTIKAKTLVVGYPKDPLHRDSEVQRLLGELPDSRYLRLRSMYQLHTDPDSLLDPVVEFLDECWSTPEPR
ncbi:alpha/beta hydrolase [Nocardia sp. NPDC051030]|uniref:alpha/beta fold hydrolase n=1 Tax=Nocardia sp. NPDC051030 TaxID=3155162 RepID=UPI003430FBC4